jgi:hypothetical protein
MPVHRRSEMTNRDLMETAKAAFDFLSEAGFSLVGTGTVTGESFKHGFLLNYARRSDSVTLTYWTWSSR